MNTFEHFLLKNTSLKKTKLNLRIIEKYNIGID